MYQKCCSGRNCELFGAVNIIVDVVLIVSVLKYMKKNK
nr:MAG TPA: hypothetical protein [Caudoviricetes sp.]